jgi:hypothetical protein
MVLEFTQADAQPDGLLSGYLHDAPFTWSRNAFDEAQRRLVVTAWRFRHEVPLRKPLLGFIPQVGFQGVPAELAVLGVVRARLDPQVLKPNRKAIFDYAEFKESTLSLYFQGETITAELATWTRLELRDVGPPTKRPQMHFMFARTVFEGMADELRKRTSDA